jgi:hypothetical protein
MHNMLGSLISASTFAFLTVAPAAAQTRVVAKTLVDNANVTVRLTTYAPGAINKTLGPGRLVYIVQGPQKFKRTSADGHSTMQIHKTGDAYWLPAGVATITNVGPNTTTVLAVFVKK